LNKVRLGPKRKSKVSIAPSNLVFATYRHFPYTLADALAELVDNSTQSFFDCRRALRRQTGVTIAISYSRSNGTSNIVVRDDAFGMGIKELRRALRLAEPPPNAFGRCEFGMGLKTSCCWLGDIWSVRTKRFGDQYEYTVVFDVARVVGSKNSDIELYRKRVPSRSDHYTEITVSALHREYHTRTIAKAKQRLAQAYQRDIAEGSLKLSFNGESLYPTFPDLLIEDGKAVRSEFAFSVDGHDVKGWVGLLAHGRGSSAAGFDIFRRGRLIVPNHKFIGPGLYPEVTTNIIHQRLVGSLDLDTVPVVHLKNGIDLRNLREQFEEKLAREIREMRGRAITLRYLDNGRSLDASAADFAVPVGNVMCSDLNVDDSTSAQHASGLITRSVVAQTDQGQSSFPLQPIRSFQMRGRLVKVFLIPTKADDAYARYEDAGVSLKIFINPMHPCFSNLDEWRYDAFIDEVVRDVLSSVMFASPDLSWLERKDAVLRAESADMCASMQLSQAG
jgi:Histidine kinase-, DNA gyrase B-, and HSP90-like ATPase